MPRERCRCSFAIQQAYIALRTPIGNGIDWKVGVFNSPIGYESFDAGNNPNYTRSWGYAVEPTSFTGVLGSYKINDQWSVSAGIANTANNMINGRAWNNEAFQGLEQDAHGSGVLYRAEFMGFDGRFNIRCRHRLWV